MPNIITNSILDVCGITRAILYRTFVERKWKPPQPMFNVLEVKEGREATFEEFLSQAQVISGKLNTPVSLGPFRTDATRVYIYVTHYASTFAFIGVMVRLTLTLVTLKRSAATERTSWTYCRPTEESGFSQLSKVLVVGVQGAPAALDELLRANEIVPAGRVERIRDVRGRSQGSYLVLPDEDATERLLTDFRENGGDIVIYKAATFE